MFDLKDHTSCVIYESFIYECEHFDKEKPTVNYESVYNGNLKQQITVIYKGFPKFIKEKYFRMSFQILNS